MAVCNLRFRSKILGKMTELNVLLPEIAAAGAKPVSQMKVLTLLHGLTDDAASWLSRTSAPRYAEEKNICIVLPDGGRTFYVDMADGLRYEAFLKRELPQVLSRTFGISADKEKNMIAGLSMGGYGALYHGLKGDRYCKIGSFSAPTDITVNPIYRGENTGLFIYKKEFECIFGDDSRCLESDINLFVSAKKNKDNAPPIYLSCGTEDTLISANRAFSKELTSLGIEHTYRETSGAHTWDVWDSALLDFLNWAL